MKLQHLFEHAFEAEGFRLIQEIRFDELMDLTDAAHAVKGRRGGVYHGYEKKSFIEFRSAFGRVMSYVNNDVVTKLIPLLQDGLISWIAEVETDVVHKKTTWANYRQSVEHKANIEKLQSMKYTVLDSWHTNDDDDNGFLSYVICKG